MYLRRYVSSSYLHSFLIWSYLRIYFYFIDFDSLSCFLGCSFETRTVPRSELRSQIWEGSLLNMSFDLIGLSCYIEIKQQDGTSSDLSAVRKSQKTILPISLTFGRQGGYHTITDRLQMPTRASRQTSRSPSWPGLTRRHAEKNTRDPILVNESTNNEINGSTTQGEWSVSKLWCIENLVVNHESRPKKPKFRG